MSPSKEQIIQALQADSFELELSEADDGKNIRDLFREHAIKIVERIDEPTINDIKKMIEEQNSESEYDSDSNTSPNQN